MLHEHRVTHKYMNTHSHTDAQTDTRIHALRHRHRHRHTYIHTHTHTLTHTHSHTHTHTHTCSPTPWRSVENSAMKIKKEQTNVLKTLDFCDNQSTASASMKKKAYLMWFHYLHNVNDIW